MSCQGWTPREWLTLTDYYDPRDRIIPCGACGGDGGGYEGGNEIWIRCVLCDGAGEIEIELEPIDMEDLEQQ